LNELDDVELPIGWALARLGDLGNWYGGGTPSKNRQEFWTDGSIPWLSPKDMGPEVVPFTRDHITPSAVAVSAVRIIPAQSVAIVVRSGILERTVPVALVPFETTLNQDMKATVAYDGVSPRWIAWAVRASAQEILNVCRKAGTTVASLSTDALMDFRIPLAPLAEQHRIVEALEGHLSRLDAACDGLRRSLAHTVRLRQTAITRALRGDGVPLLLDEGTAEDLYPHVPLAPSEHPWEVPDGWLWTTIGNLFNVYVGTTPSRKAPELWSGHVPWVSSGEVGFGRISETREHITENAVGNKATRLHPPGTVMIAMIGEGKTRGQVGILDVEAAHNQNCASIRVSETRILPEYIYLVLEQRYLRSRRASSGGNQPALNKAKVEAIPIPVPPLATQRKIVSSIDELGVTSNHFRLEIDRALKRAATLRRAILSYAFNGKLVPQETSDESASILLDRIRDKRSVAPSKHRRARGRSHKTNAARAESPPPPPISGRVPVPVVQQELPF
jgi:type I restriction enzyme S subunit